MSNFMEYKDKIAFHPGYYIKEIVDDSGLTQEDFAKRLDTTPKNLSLLIRGEQSLSIDIAMKLSRMLGTSVNYWLNLQNTYDALIAEFKSDEELEAERRVFEYFDYKYFRENFGLPDLPRNKDAQIKALREFLNVATLTVFTRRDMAAKFRGASDELPEADVTRANAMVQLAINEALRVEAPKYSKSKFEKVAESAAWFSQNRQDFYQCVKTAFEATGVILIALPSVPGAGVCGATKKVGQHVMLLVNEPKTAGDAFMRTLNFEIQNVKTGNFGISFRN